MPDFANPRPQPKRPPRQPTQAPSSGQSGIQYPRHYAPNNPNMPAWMQGNNARQYVPEQQAQGQTPFYGYSTHSGVQIWSTYYVPGNPGLPAWMQGNNASQYVSIQEAQGKKKRKWFR